MDFWISLSCRFDVTDQLTTIINILHFLLQLPDDRDAGEEFKRLPPDGK